MSSIKIKIDDWHDIHNGFDLELTPGVNYLIGPNGAGKTTLLHQIRDYFNNKEKEEDFCMLNYSNLVDGGSNAIGKQFAFSRGNLTLAATLASSSEGEQIAINFGQFLGSVGKFIREELHGRKLIITIDAVDSGASIDRLRDIKDVFNLILKEDPNLEIYIVCAVNCYELIKDSCGINPRTGERHTFSSYDEYSEWICNYMFNYSKKEET